MAGAISTIAGRYLTPVITGQAGAGILKRAGLGFLDQAAQGAGVGASNYVANETAAGVYDKGRSPTWEGLGHAAGEAAAAQGVVGAGFAAVHGRSGPLRDNKAPNQPNPTEIHSTMANTPENKATGAATEEHTSGAGAQREFDFDTRQPPQQMELGPLEQGPRGPPPGGGGPGGQMDFGFPRPEPQQGELPLQHQPQQADMFNRPDLAAAIRAHYEGAQPAEPQPAIPNGMQEPNGPQGNLDLRGGAMNPPRPPPGTNVATTPAQLNLPMRTPGRGGPQMPPVAEPPRTRADELRARAAQPAPDINQPDLFRDTQNPRTLTTRGNRPMVAGTPDHPTAEPFADIQAQLSDLRDPQHERGGVYLSADNVASLRQRGLFERVRGEAGPNAQELPNFDGKGGLLIAKDPQHAELYTHYRDQKVGNMQEILGEATGAGHGKGGNGELTVQQHDEHGNVTRESVVGSPQEAEQLQRAYTDVARGRTAQVVSTPAAILRRAQLIGLEHEQLARGAAEKGTRRAVSEATEAAIPRDQALAERARGASARDLATGKESAPVSREEAARRVTAEAQRVHNETAGRAWRGLGAPDPRDIEFRSEDAQRQYQELDHELAGMRVMRNTARTPEDVAHADAGISAAERRLAAFLRAQPHQTRAEQVARAAVRLSPEGVREFAENNRAVGRQYVRPLERLKVSEFEPQKAVSRSALRQMHPTELESRYQEALDRTARTRAETVHEGPREGLSAQEEAGEHQPSAATREEMIAEDRGLRSLKEKRIARYYRTQAEYEARGFSNAKSDKVAVSPRRALTERETQLNAAKTKFQKKIVGYKTFDPENLMATVESQREMEMNTQDRKSRNAMRNNLQKDLITSVARGEKAIKELGKVSREDIEGNPIMARSYMRQILQYGRALRDGSMKGAEAMSAAKQFIAHMKLLADKAPADRAQYLVDAFNTELKRQNLRASGANPVRLAHNEELGERYAERAAHEAGGEQAAPAETGRSTKYFGEPSKGQLSLPFEERPQLPESKRGYEGANRPGLTPAEVEEMRGLINEPADTSMQKKLALRGGQAEPQGTTIEVKNLSQWQTTQNLELEAHRSALGYPQKPTAFKGTAGAIAAHLEDGPVNAHTVIGEVLKGFPPGSPMHKLFSAFSRVVDKNSMVGWTADEKMTNKTLGQTRWTPDGPNIHLNRALLEDSRARGAAPEYELMRTLAHEMAHIATRRAIDANPDVEGRLEAILAHVRQQPGAGEVVWLSSRPAPTQFMRLVAEAYGNERFQRFLDSIRMPNTGRSIWTQFKRIVSDILGFHGDTQNYTALDAIMREHGTIFKGKQYHLTPGERTVQNLEIEDKDGSHLGNGIDRITKSLGLDSKTMTNLAADATQGAGQAGLSAMTPRQQSAQFSKYFEGPDGNPYKRYWDTYFPARRGQCEVDGASRQTVERVVELGGSPWHR